MYRLKKSITYFFLGGSSSVPPDTTVNIINICNLVEHRAACLQTTNKTAPIYIQYFCMKFFSGTGLTTSPSGVRGGGALSSGLAKDVISQEIITIEEKQRTEAASQFPVILR